jgi:hypothetical protein
MGGVTAAAETAAAETIKTSIMETVPYKQQHAYERTVSHDKRKKGDMIDPYILNKEDASNIPTPIRVSYYGNGNSMKTLICSWTVSG